jgi:magnesium transporter
MLKELLKPEIEELIEEHRWRELKEVLVEWNPSEVAYLLSDLKTRWAIILFRLLPKDFAYDVFSYLEPEKQELFLKELTQEETIQIVEEMDPDDRTALFEELPAELVQKIIGGLTKAERDKAIKLLGYPEDSVGRLMTTDYLTIKPDFTRDEALEYIRKFGKDKETINILYVVDDSGRLVDDVHLHDIIFAEPDEKIGNILDGKVVYLSAYDDQEKALNIMKQYDYSVLPVVDSSGILVGIVTFDDILDVAEEEMTEDIHKISSVIPIDISYRNASPFRLYLKRVVWLIALVLADLSASKIIEYFSYMIAAITALAFFMPVLIDTGGNAGSQISTIIIRALATGEFKPKELWKTILKELIVALLLALSLGLIIFGITFLWRGITVNLAIVVGLSMLLIIIWTNLVGLLLPIIFNAVRIDPAVASSPLITTIADASGLFIYFFTAKQILRF